jgi:GntP family gluconate:H+ symporter
MGDHAWIYGFSHEARLLLITLIAVGGLVLLVAWFKVNSFFAMILAGLFAGICLGLPLGVVVKSFSDGVGAVLGSIALVIGLGAMIGKLLGESGGAEVVARTLIGVLGEKRTPWTMLITALLVGIPVFFGVGVVLLMPIVITVARETKRPLLSLGIPLLAGLSVAHGLFPPHPGPMAAIELLHADVGRVILYSLLLGVPAAVVAGPLLAPLLLKHVRANAGAEALTAQQPKSHPNPPSFPLAVTTILSPVVLMLAATLADVTLPATSRAREWADFVGNPVVALLAALLLSFWSFGFARGFDRKCLLKFCDECLGPVAGMLLIIGAGGGLNRVLVTAGVGGAIASMTGLLHLSPLVLGWLVAALIRVATGSATVAISTAAGILAPMALASPGIHREWLVLAMGSGSLILSHVNDGGFWFVKEYLHLTVPETLRTWTVMSCVLSFLGLIGALVFDKLLP